MELINNNKRSVILAATLAVSLFFPVSFIIGTICGTLATSIFLRKFIHTGRLNLLIFNIGNWQVHVHHWVSGMIIILCIYFIGILPDISYFWIGAVSGMIIHDLYTDDIWYKVIYRVDE